MESMSPLNQAHQHAANAEDYLARGILTRAAEEHYRAAEGFKLCIEQSNDETMKRTLRMLYADNSKAGKDLQRRIEKLKEDGKDPDQPQASSSARRAPSRTPSASSSLHARLEDSQNNTFDESFMVLAQQPQNHDDPFNVFWRKTEDYGAHLSQPNPFYTAALAALAAMSTNPVSEQEPTTDSGGNATSSLAATMPSKAHKPTDRAKGKAPGGDETEDGYESSDSFYLVDSAGSSATLRKENAALRKQLEAMHNQVTLVQKQLTQQMAQDQQFRDQIQVARVEAQRAMAASSVGNQRPVQSVVDVHAWNTSNVPVSHGPGGDQKQAYLLRRIRDLEEELRLVRVENDKQKAMISKFRERWEKLKESAKRKRSAKAAAHAEESLANDRIDEDPEAEAAAEDLQ